MRLKLTLGSIAVVLFVGAASYFFIRSEVRTALLDDVDSSLARDYTVIERSLRYAEYRLLEDTSAQAAGLADVFATTDENGRRSAAFERAQSTVRWFGEPARGYGVAPDVVLIIDDTGRVVARNSDRNRMYRTQIRDTVPQVAAALQGQPSGGLWNQAEESKWLRAAVAPIRDGEQRIIGALLVAYDINSQLATSEGARVNRDVAFVTASSMYSSSFASQGASAVYSALQGGHGAALTGALGGTMSGSFSVSANGNDYGAVVGPYPGSSTVAVAIFGNRSERAAKASVLNLIWVFTAIGIALATALSLFVANNLMREISSVEETILAVINGRSEARVDIESEELGGLAYRVNQLINLMAGIAETDDNAAPSSWQGGGTGAGPAAPGPSAPSSPGPAPGADGSIDDPELAAKLASETEEVYLNRVFDEYVAAKQAAGENVSNIPKDRFIQRLKTNSETLKSKHGCKDVRFVVQSQQGAVNLTPVLIR